MAPLQVAIAQCGHSASARVSVSLITDELLLKLNRLFLISLEIWHLVPAWLDFL